MTDKLNGSLLIIKQIPKSGRGQRGRFCPEHSFELQSIAFFRAFLCDFRDGIEAVPQ